MSSTPTFSFGSAGGSGSSNPFGAASNTSQGGSNNNLFSTSSAPNTSSVFGQPRTATSQPPSNSPFGGGTVAGANSFGTSNAGPTQPASSFGTNTGSNPATSLFGANSSTGNAPAGGIFGQVAGTTSSAGSTGGLLNTAGTSSPFGSSTTGFNFGQKKDDAVVSTPVSNESKLAPIQGGGLFGNPSKPSGTGIFGSSSLSAVTTFAPGASTTPASNKTFNFSNSTTPAGPPPTDNGQAKSLFSSVSQQPASAGLFGSAKPTDSTQPKAGSLFPGTPATGTSLFGAKPATTGGMFNINPVSAPASSGASTMSIAAPISDAPKPTISFQTGTPTNGTPATQTSTNVAAPATTATALFGTPTSSAPAPISNLFGGLSGATTTTAPATSASTPAPAAAASLFGGVGKTTSNNTSATPSTTAPAAAPSMFGTKPAATTTTLPSSTPAAAATSSTTAGSTNNQSQPNTNALGASTAGPAPQLSRLKNKTMDEIITRWASDLLKYQKDFQEQAGKVAAWDRLLVENGEKIQALYSSTYEAMGATKEIERQLSNVEGQQAELTSWLDRYEADVDEMFARQVGQGESLQGPDQERERTYKLAEKLTDRLDEMGKNMTSMIEAINDASTNLSKNTKSDDPLSHIVRVLNSHLTQLQWIDQNAEVLQAKVAAAQKLGQNISSNGYGGLESDAADSFYRSYMGRR